MVRLHRCFKHHKALSGFQKLICINMIKSRVILDQYWRLSESLQLLNLQKQFAGVSTICEKVSQTHTEHTLIGWLFKISSRTSMASSLFRRRETRVEPERL